MAGSISHVVYAEHALQSFLPEYDKKRFIIGTLFPDIRYLGHVSRHRTHVAGVTLADIRAESDACRAGMLFHTLVDESREAFVVNHHEYRTIPKSRLSTVAFKICEDEHLHSKINDWEHYTAFLDTIDTEEQLFQVPEEVIRKWHDLNIRFLPDPSPTKNRWFIENLGFDQHQVKETTEIIKEVVRLGLVDTYIDDYYDNLETILENFK